MLAIESTPMVARHITETVTTAMTIMTMEMRTQIGVISAALMSTILTITELEMPSSMEERGRGE